MSINIDSVKKFALAVLKIGCGISLAVLILGLAVWGARTLGERWEAAANAPLATLKTWPEVTAATLGGTKFTLRTVWRDGKIYYQFDVNGYPPVIAQAKERETQAAFTINFLDSDGFRLFQQTLVLAEMSRIVNSDGKAVGISWKGDEYASVDSYRRAEDWELGWSGFSATAVVAPPPTTAAVEPTPPMRPSATRTPTPAARPKWRDVSFWRTLRRGISKDEVRHILGEPEKISELGFQTTWYYGYPLGGDLTFGSDGTLQSWSEP